MRDDCCCLAVGQTFSAFVAATAAVKIGSIIFKAIVACLFTKMELMRQKNVLHLDLSFVQPARASAQHMQGNTNEQKKKKKGGKRAREISRSGEKQLQVLFRKKKKGKEL